MNSQDYSPNATPLHSLDEWEEDLLVRYPDPETIAKGKTTERIS